MTTFSVLENITTDQIVATLEVIDQDSSQTHVCSVTQGPSSYFDFRTDPSSGNITMSVLSSAPLDYETQPEITGKSFTVQSLRLICNKKDVSKLI